MVSRRKILSRSRDDLNLDQPQVQENEDDVWHQKDKLFKVSINILQLYNSRFTKNTYSLVMDKKIKSSSNKKKNKCND